MYEDPVSWFDRLSTFTLMLLAFISFGLGQYALWCVDYTKKVVQENKPTKKKRVATRVVDPETAAATAAVATAAAETATATAGLYIYII